jgi:hypothetical protein
VTIRADFVNFFKSKMSKKQEEPQENILRKTAFTVTHGHIATTTLEFKKRRTTAH